MFELNFEFREAIVCPDEYSMGWLTMQHNDLVLKSSDLSGRGLMMVFFSITSLLECTIKLNVKKSKPIKFVGEDSSFILFFKRVNDEVEITHENKTWSKIGFNDFCLSIWKLSQLLFENFNGKFESNNIAWVDWVKVRNETLNVYPNLS